jgi:hypothetical protein
MPSHHDALWSVCRHLPADYLPYGNALREGPDCSGGCAFYYQLADRDDETINYDWGVCANPKSHRVALLTFEHQGCAHFQS